MLPRLPASGRPDILLTRAPPQHCLRPRETGDTAPSFAGEGRLDILHLPPSLLAGIPSKVDATCRDAKMGPRAANGALAIAVVAWMGGRAV